MSPTLGYWNIRGLGQPIRLLLAYTETEFVDKRYKEGPAPQYDRKQWLNDKWELGLDFPNLPYYLDGSVKLSQSVTIIRYIARKNRLDGQTEEEKNRVDLVEQQLRDLNAAFVGLLFSQNFTDILDNYLKGLPQELTLLEKFLGDRPFLAGKNVTYVDFLAYEYLDKVNVLSPGIRDQFSKLNRLHSRIASLPQISKYLKTAPKLPITEPMDCKPADGLDAYFTV